MSQCFNLAITAGDPAGVGPELIGQALRQVEASEAWTYTVIGPPHPQLDELAQAGLAEREILPAKVDWEPGKPTIEGGRIAVAAMEAAAQGCLDGRFHAVVTGPISKIWCVRAGYRYPGQTEFFAARWRGAEPTMAFVGERLKLALATWHHPLREVPSLITESRLRRAVERAHHLASRLGVEQPRIGVCGLNPHAGEGGILGEEESEKIDPWLASWQSEFPGLSLAQPADTLFARAIKREFDVVVALYHDQGLAPLKTVDFDNAVNVTLGLPFLRASPDHGTAFDIAGQGKASARSLANAISLARSLSGKTLA